MSPQHRPSRGAIGSLARLLDVPAEDLGFLEPLPHAQVDALADALAASVTAEAVGTLERLARISTVVPSPVAAQVAYRALGPSVSARLLPLLPSRLIGDIAGRVPGSFLAEVASAAHTSELRNVVPGLTLRTLKTAAHHLAEAGDHLTLASVAGVVESHHLPTLIGGLDSQSVLATTVFVDDPAVLDAIIAVLSDDELAGLVQAASDEGAWAPAFDLLDRVQPRTQARLAELVLSLPAAVLDEAVRAATDLGAWPEILAVVPSLSDAGRAALVDAVGSLVIDAPDDVLVAVVDSITAGDLDDADVDAGLGLLSEMAEPALERLAALASTLPRRQAKLLALVLGPR